MKNPILSVFFILLAIQFSFAQRDLDNVDEPSFRDRIYFGGGGIFQLNQNYFVVGASPIVGYMITPKLSSGVGVTYQYARYKFLNPPNTSHTYGGRLFTRYNILPVIYTMAEYEMLSVEMPMVASDLPRQWVDRLLLGGGYFQRFSGRGGFNIGVLYDVLYRYGLGNKSPYDSPWVFRVGFTF